MSSARTRKVDWDELLRNAELLRELKPMTTKRVLNRLEQQLMENGPYTVPHDEGRDTVAPHVDKNDEEIEEWYFLGVCRVQFEINHPGQKPMKCHYCKSGCCRKGICLACRGTGELYWGDREDYSYERSRRHPQRPRQDN